MSEAVNSRLDPLKWGVVLLLIAAGVVGNSYYADQSLLYRVLALVVLALLAGWVAAQTSRGAAFWSLIKGSRTEIRRRVLCGGSAPSSLERDVREGEIPVEAGFSRSTRRSRGVGLFGNAALSRW